MRLQGCPPMTPIVFDFPMESGHMAEVNVLVMSLSEWEDRPESLSTLWQVHLAGDTVTACSLDLVRASGKVASGANVLDIRY